ncbi:Glycosyl transferase, group 2 family protein [Chitinispirillum alkaliphilum]|nr:Glycosyl transferase, group 2 family protein [Chitinispirillum alkaliphilum]
MLELLISATGKSVNGINKNVKSMRKASCTVICQNREEEVIPEDIAGNGNVRVYSYAERGVSKSRNRALRAMSEPIALLSDDDVVFLSGFEEKIIAAFDKNPYADIICFQILNQEGKLFKDYYRCERSLSKLNCFKVSSIEIAFRSDRVRSSGLVFDEYFGLGSRYPLGEETIFLCDALDKGLKVHYVPETIAIHPSNSSGRVHSREKIIARGAQLRRIYRNTSCLWALLFALKKKGEYSGEYTIGQYFNLLKLGIKDYEKVCVN